jgi:hypothetical protein
MPLLGQDAKPSQARSAEVAIVISTCFRAGASARTNANVSAVASARAHTNVITRGGSRAHAREGPNVTVTTRICSVVPEVVWKHSSLLLLQLTN